MGWILSATTGEATPTKCGGDGFTSTSATSTKCDVPCPKDCLTCNVEAA
jgi:hypothetical protein